MKTYRIEAEFVPRIPELLSDGILYICLPCNVAVHLCACGCKEKVVTPIDPKGWSMIYDGDTVSLNPSIGNGVYKCRSHYYIRNNEIKWLPPICKNNESTDKRDQNRRRKKKKNIFSKWFQ